MSLRSHVIRRLVATVTLTLSAAQATAAQRPDSSASRAWNAPETLELVSRAIGRRTAQLADTGLSDYQAVAHGYLTFLAQLGEGFPDPPQIVRADELAVEVYWRAPNQSKQRVVGRRDTLLLPTDIAYHRDHIAIVQNNFPAIIRLGDGDEVRDVPHPLSLAGQSAYDYATTDSLTIRVAGRAWDVIAVEIRPRDDRLARVIGTIYLDRESAAVVRLALTFTRAALIDPALEDVSVVLDNGLVDGRFWLPRRQEIEIRRTGTWLEFPARGVIRGEWDLCCIETNRALPAERFAGPEISVASPAELSAYRFPGTLADSLGARIRAAGQGRPAEVLQRRAAELVRGAALRRTTGAKVAGAGVSDFIRVNRVEGAAFGAGAEFGLGAVGALRVGARYGIDDARFKYRTALSRTVGGLRWQLNAFDEHRDVGLVPEMSGVGNSLAAQEFGADVTDEYRARGAGIAVSGAGAYRWSLGLERVEESPLAVHATPSSGSYRPAFPADAISATRAVLRVGESRVTDDGGHLSIEASLAGVWITPTVRPRTSADPRFAPDSLTGDQLRATLRGDVAKPLALGAVHLTLAAGFVSGDPVPRQDELRFGGPVTGPGYVPHSLAGPVGAALRMEWRVPVTSIAIPLGRFGGARSPVILAPFASGAWVGGVDGRTPSVARSVGVGVISFHSLLRLDVARGVDRNGRWTVYADFGRAIWPIL